VDSEKSFLSAQNCILFNKDKTELCTCGGDVREVIIPDTLKTFDFGAFIKCHNFQKVKIPEGVEYFSDKLFFECSKLVTVELPKSLKYIDSRAFERITTGLVISVEKGSYAETYVKHFGYPHKVL
jgi:hypothetical protein